MEHLHRNKVELPTGGRLTVRRFQQVGFMLGFDDGMENLHYLLESAFCTGVNGDELSLPFLRTLENSLTFDTNPIFAVLHEMCYTQEAASRWSAQRVRAEFPDMDWAPGRPLVHWRNDLSVDVRGLQFRRCVTWPSCWPTRALARSTIPRTRPQHGSALQRSAEQYVPRAHRTNGCLFPDSRSGSPTNTSTMACARRRGVRAPARAAAGTGLSNYAAFTTSGSFGRVANACFIIVSISAVSFGLSASRGGRVRWVPRPMMCSHSLMHWTRSGRASR